MTPMQDRGYQMRAAASLSRIISVCIAACALISLISAALMPDYTGKDISAEYDAAAVPAE